MGNKLKLLALLALWAILALAAAPPLAQAAEQQLVYRNDFEGAVGSEWSNTSVDTISGRRLLGRFANETVSMRLTSLPPHTQVTLSFHLFILLSWDGHDNPYAGPDLWNLSVEGGPTLLNTTFATHGSWVQAYPGTYPGPNNPPNTGAAEVGTLGDLFWVEPDNAVYYMSFIFPHSADSLVLNFSASGLQGLWDESWGLDNVEVRVHTPTPTPSPSPSPTPKPTPALPRGGGSLPDPATWALILSGSALFSLYALAQKRRGG